MSNDTFDLEAYRAEHAEETPGKTFPVRLGTVKDDEGNEVEEFIYIPELRYWTLSAETRIANGDIVGGIEEVVGPADAELFSRYEWRFGEFEALFERLSKWSGFKMGRGSSRPPAPGMIRR